MPIQIVTKQKTEPQCPQQHKSLVPLRVTTVRDDRLRPYDKEHGIAKHVEVGDVIVVLPDKYSHAQDLFNCTKQNMIDRKYWDNGAILCLRAYDVAQIILTNDNEPAPV